MTIKTAEDYENKEVSFKFTGTLIDKKNNKPFQFETIVVDGYAICRFSEKGRAKQLWKHNKKKGRYAEKIDAYVEEYPTKKAEEIKMIIERELKSNQANFKQEKKK